jgi:hypothetical protein
MAGTPISAPLDFIGVAAVGLCVYLVGLGLYRLYFSPIAQFPGPKLAALTLWYEFYHDVVRGGQYVFKIDELHEQYGTAITSSPSPEHEY